MSQQPGDARTSYSPFPGGIPGRRKKNASYASTLEERARRQARAQRRFIKHVVWVLAFTLFLFIIDAASGGGWWFYWWPIGWSIFLIGHAMRLYGPQNRFDDAWEDRKTQELIDKQRKTVTTQANKQKSGSNGRAEMPSLIASGNLAVATMRIDARKITKPSVQAQALRICDRADATLQALGEPDRDVPLAREFVERVLPAAQTVFTSYVRLSGRQIASAQPALTRVESNDLPLIERTLDDIYQQLHRHDVISLEVASEMLVLGKPTADVAP